MPRWQNKYRLKQLKDYAATCHYRLGKLSSALSNPGPQVGLVAETLSILEMWVLPELEGMRDRVEEYLSEEWLPAASRMELRGILLTIGAVKDEVRRVQQEGLPPYFPVQRSA